MFNSGNDPNIPIGIQYFSYHRNEFNCSSYYASLLCTSRSQPRVSFSGGISQNARISSILRSSDLRNLCPMHSPKQFDNVPKMVSILPKVKHEHKHLPILCAAFRMHCQINLQGVQLGPCSA
jgi:hypothetical protein